MPPETPPADEPAAKPRARLHPAHRALRWVLVCVLLAGGGYGAYRYVDAHWPYKHFRTVKAGAFYRCSQLDGKDLADCIQRYGIKTIFNLRDVPERQNGTWYATEKRVAASKGVKLVDVPMPAGLPPSPAQIRTMLAVMDKPANLPVLVHCYHGTIRSAAVEGLYRREYLHETGAQAFDRVETWGRDLQADYPQIADFIRSYKPRARKAP
jgi:uncharacterized protein (TIGR01244 family)